MITVSENGPHFITGGIEVVGHEPRAEEVSTEHCTLCRCGSSKNKPFCDGTHWDIGFKDEKN
jgi:CDGSH-type Zn-finger protein